jgi:hypothetical protein
LLQAIFGFNLTDAEVKELDAYTPPSQCKANKWCAAIAADGCIMAGCRACDGDGDGEPSRDGAAAVGFQADVVRATGSEPGLAGSKCGSCGCNECCSKCVLKTAGKVTYCSNP